MLRLVANGFGDRPIAMILGCGPATVASHVKSINDKLGARTRTQACVLARQRGDLIFDGFDHHVR